MTVIVARNPFAPPPALFTSERSVKVNVTTERSNSMVRYTRSSPEDYDSLVIARDVLPRRGKTGRMILCEPKSNTLLS
jgi:hypothetical protein